MIRKRTGPATAPDYDKVERWAEEPNTSAGEKQDTASAEASNQTLPWETGEAQSRADVMKQYPLRLPEPYMMALDKLAHLHQMSKQRYLQQAIEVAIETDARSQYGRGVLTDQASNSQR